MTAVERARLNARHWKQRPTSGANVIAFPGATCRLDPSAQLTTAMVLERHRAGTLDAGIVAALLAGCGVSP
jgi:hypothetical protein